MFQQTLGYRLKTTIMRWLSSQPEIGWLAVVVPARNSREIRFAVMCRLVAFIAMGTCGLLAQNAAAQSRDSTVTKNLLTQTNSRRAQAKLRLPAGFTMTQTPLRTGLQNISRSYNISIWVDRRVDPTQLIDLGATQGGTLEEALTTIASLADAEIGLIENVLYVGPKGEVAKLQRCAVVLYDQLHSAQATGNSGRATRSTESLVGVKPLAWPELCSAEDFLHTVLDNWQLQSETTLPHDLMHAGELVESCSLATQCVLACGSWQYQPILEGRTIRLVPLADDKIWKAIYAATHLSTQAIADVRTKFPGATAKRRGKQWNISGPIDFHLQLLSRPQPVRRPDVAQTRVSGEIGGVVENIIKQLSAMNQLEARWADAVTAADKAKYVKFRVTDATLEDIFTEFSSVSGLTIKLDGSTIRISR